MTSSRTIVVGDPHGVVDEFRELIKLVEFRPGQDRLIIAGDLVDRGPDSPGMVRLAMELGAEAVAGNHDAKLLRRWGHMDKVASNPKYRNPMKPHEDQERTISLLGASERAWLDSLPYYIYLPQWDVIVVHAGLLPGVPLQEQTKEILTMVRYVHRDTRKMLSLVMPGFKQPPDSVFWAEIWDGTSDVIFGHTVVSLDKIQAWDGVGMGRAYGIDTGAVFGGRLTAMILDPDLPRGREVVQVQAHREYFKLGSEM